MQTINPGLPTDAPAGSLAKIETMRRRHEVGLPLFHPDDSTKQIPPPYGPANWEALARDARAPAAGKRPRWY
jgi:hypothetical protein